MYTGKFSYIFNEKGLIYYYLINKFANTHTANDKNEFKRHISEMFQSDSWKKHNNAD
jgi:hypothetical protein